jgi:hypothetical protein
MSESVVDQIDQLFRGEHPSFLLDPAVWPSRRSFDETPTAAR